MRASLADQADRLSRALQRPGTLAIALGANLPSPAGPPAATLLAVRPRLEQLLADWARAPLQCRWSPLLQTAPVGGPPGQSDFVNGALLVELPRATPTTERALALLCGLQQLESRFGRPPLAERLHWGPRSLDLDLLWWGSLVVEHPQLRLPHPLWRQRPFVLEPLAALVDR